MDLIEIGRVGRSHGLKGEVKLIVEPHFEEDLFNASAVLVGDPPIPYFLVSARGGGALIVKFEDLNAKEDVALLSNRPVFLKAEDVRDPNPVREDSPFSHLVGFHIEADGYDKLGPILEVVDMPQHHLALIKNGDKEFYIPLHNDLIIEEKSAEKILLMNLPSGLLS